jgi:catalase
MSSWEKRHIVEAYRFELSKVTARHIRERMVEHLNHVDHALALSVAAGIGVVPPTDTPGTHGRVSPALSQTSHPGSGGVAGRAVAVLVADGVVATSVSATRDALTAAGVKVDLLGPVEGTVTTAKGRPLPVDHALRTVGSVLYDAAVVADGEDAVSALVGDGYAVHFVAEAYKHGKALGVLGAGDGLVRAARLPVFPDPDGQVAPAARARDGSLDGVVFLAADARADKKFVDDLCVAIAKHRHHDRPVDGVAA